MKLRTQIILLTSAAMLVPVLLISGISIYNIKRNADEEIEHYRQDELTKLKLYVKHIVDIAYATIEVAHQNSKTAATSSLVAADSTQLPEDAMSKALSDLSKIRFDKGEGYFWVTNNALPYPTMLMHAEKSNLKGVLLNDEKYNVERNTRQNIYTLRASLCNQKGDGFVEYTMKKPGIEQIFNKISYSRLYAPLGWIVSTGMYTDQIDLAIAAKQAQLTDQLQRAITAILSCFILTLVTGLYISYRFSDSLVREVLRLKDHLKSMALGKKADLVITKRQDELGEMTQSLNAMVSGIDTYTNFARGIGQGDLVQSFQPLSEEDELGMELLSMRDNLKKAAEEEAKRKWTTEGLAMFGDLLRKNNANVKQMSQNLLAGLINYLKANQGGLFIKNEEKEAEYLELVAAYAYSRVKYVQKKISLGQGLLGQCALEKSTLHLTEIPADYIHITSGLGQALPRTILIVPLIHNETLYGVIELASFNRFKDFEIQFVEKISESIASTISTVMVNEETQQLLSQSQQMGEELRAQEEELRQNQEELQATQEQMRRRQDELERENEMLQRTLAAQSDKPSLQ
jgi:hypothetical protein